MAAYHDRYSETTTAIYPAAQSYQDRNKLKNFKLSQEHVVKIEGWCEMPMGPDPKKSRTQILEIRQPSGYALAVVEIGKREVL